MKTISLSSSASDPGRLHIGDVVRIGPSVRSGTLSRYIDELIDHGLDLDGVLCACADPVACRGRMAVRVAALERDAEPTVIVCAHCVCNNLDVTRIVSHVGACGSCGCTPMYPWRQGYEVPASRTKAARLAARRRTT